MSIKIHRINKHISLDVFEVSNRTRAKQLPSFWEQALVYILRDAKIFTEQIQRIGFLPNKRGFQVKIKNQTFFIRVLFKTNIPLPYVIRRVIGQDPCCARAHTLDENLASKATDRTTEHSQKYGTFYSMNIMPCKQCFDKYTAEEYIARVEKQRLPEFAHLPNRMDFGDIANLVLVWLMQEGNAEKVIDLNDHDLFEKYRVNHVRSVNRYFTSIAQYCRSVITSISEVDQKPAVKSAVQELQIIMNSCLDICASINNRPLKDISLDECYGYSEYMARYRQNAQNVAFALRYTGNECQILHNEDDE